MDGEKKKERAGIGGGDGRGLPPSSLLNESAFRCQSPGGIRKLCRTPLIFYPQHALPLPLLLPLLTE